MTAYPDTKRPVLAGTDGFRGLHVEGDSPYELNQSSVAAHTIALIDELHDRGINGPIIIGRDPRQDGEKLAWAATRAAWSRGVEVHDVAVAPTPAVQFAAKHSGAMACIAITASHNPTEYNGWKGMLSDGSKPDRTQVEAISERYWDLRDSGWRLEDLPQEGPRVLRAEHVTGNYHKAIVADIEHQYGDRPLLGKLFVVDGANGAASGLTPRVLRRLGADVRTFACEPGRGINDDCGAANLDGHQEYPGVKRFLRDNPDLVNDPNFVGAVANDGDADRMMAVGVRPGATSPTDYKTLNGNHIMWMQAQEQPGIVGTLYTNGGLRAALDSAGIAFEECDNGDSYVAQKLKQHQDTGDHWTRGGEFTGHNIDLAWGPSGDGVRNAALYAAHAVSQGKTFADLYDELPLWPERIGKVKVTDPAVRATLARHDIVTERQAEVADRLGNLGRIIIRASGTEPVVRVWVESDERHQTDRATDELVQAVTVARDQLLKRCYSACVSITCIEETT